uniref:Discoidin domain-containing protein n=1 Tax=Hucho hucho TaxID=62062 RepID=A0A4W5JRX6_9TELE
MHLSGSPVYLNDSTYDGSIEAGVQFGGLGQLFDGVLGGDDFTETKELRVWPGYDYLGWSREALGQGSVDIEFHFEKTRSFHTMQVTGCVCVRGGRVCVCVCVCV